MAGECMDRALEVLKQIDHLHLNYLETDESLQKIEERKKLEGCIKEYLCLVPHQCKFFLRETNEVLRRSIGSKEDFSAYQATAGWTAIAAYAHNLLAQPWRKEFHEIKTYSGYYKHNLESNLVGAELMLEAMGYKHTGRSTMVLEGPVDPDKVTIVSRDSLLALVECQIIRSIYAEVKKDVPTCTWQEVLQYRERHVDTPDNAIRGLIYRLQQRTLEEHQLRSQVDGYVSTLSRCHPLEQCPYSPCYPYNYTMAASRYVSPSYPMCHIKPHQLYGNSYYPIPNGYIPLPVPPPPIGIPNCSVPTAQLIELDPPHEPITQFISHSHRRSSSDYQFEPDIRKHIDRYAPDLYSRSITSDDLGSRKSGRNRESNRDSNWGYVLNRLEENEKKESAKKKEDFIENKKENKRPCSPLDLNDALKAFSVDDLHQLSVPERSPMKINETLNKIRLESNDNAKKKDNRKSIYDNVSPPMSMKTKQNIVTRDLKLPDIDARRLNVNLNEEWACEKCTFHNTHSQGVCEMCGKSRSKGGESKPLVSGGRECPQCTLVNEKGVTTCEACGTSLKDSPTYI